MYKIHRIFFGYESKQMPNALTPSEAALSKNPALNIAVIEHIETIDNRTERAWTN